MTHCSSCNTTKMLLILANDFEWIETYLPAVPLKLLVLEIGIEFTNNN